MIKLPFSNNDEFSKLTYDKLKEKAKDCTRCPLSKKRTHVVFGLGPVPCDLMLIGEAPGEQEDLKGEPFVGRAGQLLTQILGSVDIKRPDNIYITNTVKCRPPKNRTPTSEEQNLCKPYLKRQIELIKPKIIILAGSPAVKSVLGTTDPITKIRGQWFKLPENQEISVIPIFHPSYLLRNASREKNSPKWHTWQDMKEIKGALGYFNKLKELSEGK